MAYRILGNSIPIIDDDRNILNASTVGIGTTNPLSKLHVEGGVNVSGIITSGTHNVTTGNSYQINGTQVLNSTTLGSGVTISSLTSVGTLGSLSVIGTITASTFQGTASTANNLANASGITTGFISSERLSGSYGISITGTATTANNLSNAANITTGFISSSRLSGSYGISITGTATTANNVSSTININTSGIITATDFNSTSDFNLKTNIQQIADPLEKVMQIRGVTFDWKETNRSSAGVIAQEVEKVLPELVNGKEIKTVNYNGVIGALVEAVKKLKAENDVLKERLDEVCKKVFG